MIVLTIASSLWFYAFANEHFSLIAAVIFAISGTMSSTTIVLKQLMSANETESLFGVTAVGILIFQDVCFR